MNSHLPGPDADISLAEFSGTSVELIVRSDPGGYRTVLNRDGVVLCEKLLGTAQGVESWAVAVMGLVGQNLYVRLQPKAEYQLTQMLDLAVNLAERGLVIGLSWTPPICRIRVDNLQ